MGSVVPWKYSGNSWHLPPSLGSCSYQWNLFVPFLTWHAQVPNFNIFFEWSSWKIEKQGTNIQYRVFTSRNLWPVRMYEAGRSLHCHTYPEGPYRAGYTDAVQVHAETWILKIRKSDLNLNLWVYETVVMVNVNSFELSSCQKGVRWSEKNLKFNNKIHQQHFMVVNQPPSLNQCLWIGI